MYGMANCETNEMEMMTKVFGWMENLMKLSDGYVTAEQSKVIADVLTRLHDAKQITDNEYKKGMMKVLEANGFEMYKLS